MRACLVALVALGLAACASAPKPRPTASTQPEPPPVTAPAAPAPPAPPARKVSPYAPAQEDPSTRGDYVAGGLYKPGVPDSTPDYVPDVDAIPEPEVVAEPRSRAGNRSSYTVLGRTYHVLDDTRDFVEVGLASYYGQKFHGRRTSNLEVYDMFAFTAAHKSLPLPSFVRVTNLENGKSVVVRVNDRGPFHDGRVIDLSYAAAVKLGITQRGTGRVEVRALQPGDNPTIFAGTKPKPAGGVVRSTLDRLVAAIPVRRGGRKDSAPAATGAAVTAPTTTPVTAGTVAAGVATTGTTIPAPSLASATVQALPPPTPIAPGADAEGASILLQVASFTTQDNAARALARLHGAGIDAARLHDGLANGQKVWRLRVGPLAAAGETELAARIVGLGFGPPQRVRE